MSSTPETAPAAPHPTVVLVHGAFAESSSWSGVIEILQERGVDVVAVANPLRSVPADAAYLIDVVRGLDRPVVLVGHSYGGMVITEAAAALDRVTALVYVAAFVPMTGETALELSGRYSGSTLGHTLLSYPLAEGGVEFRIDPAKFPGQFAGDAPAAVAAVLARTQRPVTEAALAGALSVAPAWETLPTWSIYGDADRNIPAEAQDFMAERAGSRETTVVAGGSHAIAVSHPGAVATTVLAAVGGHATPVSTS
ncbi:alpha/beta fold hydrolase [Kineococcus sp. TBRC 1896]|uniref:Alpha/beta fold hydrolase n=1 Tax=Kineococcus mangrovi TaxID=1660183 RepID=A0ABV4HX68_9ACTN